MRVRVFLSGEWRKFRKTRQRPFLSHPEANGVTGCWLVTGADGLVISGARSKADAIQLVQSVGANR
jgi:hypothetical protein